MSAAEAQRDAWRPRANPWLIASAVTLGTFMEVLDSTIVNVSLPHIAGSLSAGIDQSTWTLTSYLVANSIVLPISGYFSRVFGRKNFFMLCMVCFTLCSLLCGMATSLTQLVIFRLMQGFFGGGLQPSQQAIVLDSFPATQRSSAFSLVAMATIVAPVLGPTMGGWITDNLSWRWIFWINIPVGIIATLAVWRLVEDPPWLSARDRSRPDFVGLSLIAVGFGCLQIMLDRGEDDDWFNSTFIQLLAVTAAAALGSAILWLLNNRRPIVNLWVLGDRNFALGCGMIACTTMLMYGSSIMLPQIAQTQLGYTSTLAGLVMSPGGLSVLFLIPIVSRLLPIIQTRIIAATGLAVLGASLFAAHAITPQITYNGLVWLRMSQTTGISMLFVPVSTLAYLTLPRTLNTDAAALYAMFRNLSGSFGIAATTVSASTRAQVDMAQLQRNLSPLAHSYPDAVATLEAKMRGLGMAPQLVRSAVNFRLNDTLIHQAQFAGYLDTFQYCGILAFVFVPLAFLFPPIKGVPRGGAAH